MTCPIYVPPEQGKAEGGRCQLPWLQASKTAVKWQSQAAQIKDPIKLTQIIKTLRDF